MNTIIVPLPGNEELASSLARKLQGDLAIPEVRAFPDGETYFKLSADVHGHSVVLVCTLDRANEKFLPLLFAANTARELGAARVGLVAPYLAYMRQDRQFLPGEAVSSKVLAALLSPHIDWLVTVDPHLHRLHDLSEIFSTSTRVLHAAGAIAEWIRREVKNPVLIGPDSESAQWVADVARDVDAPHIVLNKSRRGDRQVEISVPDVEPWRHHQPVVLDDIISTGRTMIETISNLRDAGLKPPVCIGVHAVFATAAYEDLLAARPARIVTTNTIKHQTNKIDLSGLIAGAAKEFTS